MDEKTVKLASIVERGRGLGISDTKCRRLFSRLTASVDGNPPAISLPGKGENNAYLITQAEADLYYEELKKLAAGDTQEPAAVATKPAAVAATKQTAPRIRDVDTLAGAPGPVNETRKRTAAADTDDATDEGKKKGASTVGIVLVVAGVAVAGFIGWQFLKHRKEAKTAAPAPQPDVMQPAPATVNETDDLIKRYQQQAGQVCIA